MFLLCDGFRLFWFRSKPMVTDCWGLVDSKRSTRLTFSESIGNEGLLMSFVADNVTDDACKG